MTTAEFNQLEAYRNERRLRELRSFLIGTASGVLTAVALYTLARIAICVWRIFG